MRKILPYFILFFLTQSAYSQNWQTAVSNRQAFFKFTQNSINNYHAIRIDSVAVSGGDSLLFPYKEVGNFCNSCQNGCGGGSCVLLKDTGWAGYVDIIKPNGDNIFITEHGDSVLLKTFADLNNSWNMMNLGSGDSIRGTITGLTYEPVLGILDSVKTITIIAHHGTNTVSNPINNIHFKISKNFGIAQTLQFGAFPVDTTLNFLDGISNPNSGVQLLKLSDIYNFNVGDLFQYYNQDDQGSWYQNNIINMIYEYIQKIILTKNVSISGDTINYSIDRMLLHHRIYNTANIDTTYFIHDTINEQYIFTSPSPLPNEGYFLRFLQDSSYLNGRRSENTSSGSCLSVDSSSLCEIIGRCIYIDYQWADGLGQVYADDADQGPMYCQHDHLVYYKKGIDTWGVPLNWSQILGINNLEKQEIRVFPNPFRDELVLNNLSNDMKEIILYDQLGRIIISEEIGNSSLMRLLTTDLAKGVYVLCILGANKEYRYRAIKD